MSAFVNTFFAVFLQSFYLAVQHSWYWSEKKETQRAGFSFHWQS